MKAIQKIKNVISPIKEIIRKIKRVWTRLSKIGKLTAIISVIMGVLLTLKIAGVVDIPWVFLYGLPLTIILALFVAVIVLLVYELWLSVKSMYNREY